MKKYLLIGIVLLATTLSACSSTNSSPTSRSESTEGSNSELKLSKMPDVDWSAFSWKADPDNLEWKEDTSDISLDYYVNFSWFSLNWKDETAKRVTERTGVDLNLTKPVSDDNQKLNMMISGNQLPDLMTLDRTDPALQTMIENDMLWSIDELIEKYAPKMKEILPKELLADFQSSDGHTYYLNTWVQGEEWQEAAKKYNQLVGANQPSLSIRKDFYDEIGRPEIHNIDDLVNVLEKISKNHPDKIAFYPADGALLDIGSNASPLGNVGTQFGLGTSVVETDGQIEWFPKDEKFKNAALSLNKMYQKGLLTKDPFIDSKDVAKAKISQGDCIAYSWVIGEGEKTPADNPDTQYEVLPPLDSYEHTRLGTGWLGTVIPKTCKDPERAIKFLEYMASEMGHMDVSWGIYGDNYSGDVVAGPNWNLVDGKPTFLAEYMKDKNADWSGVASKNGLGEYWFACNELLWNITQWDNSNEKMNEFNKIFGDKVVYVPELDLPNPDPTTDKGIILQKSKDLVQKSFVKIVTSDDPEGEYEKLLADLNKVGIEKVEDSWNKEYQNKVTQ